MKIKRKEYEALQTRLRELEGIVNSPLHITGPAGTLSHMTLEERANRAYFRDEEPTTVFYDGSYRVAIDFPRASGYDHFLHRKYPHAPTQRNPRATQKPPQPNRTPKQRLY